LNPITNYLWNKGFVIGSTASLREAFTKNEYTPELSIPSPINISHVAFNADESHLILGISTGGLAIYSIDDLSNGAGEGRPTFEVRLDDALRDLKPNPIVPELVAVLTMDRDVRILDLNSRLFKSGESGSILNSNVGAFAWSKLGKQIICGLVDGTCRQMTPDGVRKAELPAPPGLQNYYVSNIVWLTNHEFLVTHTPIPTADPDYESVFHSLTRNGNLFQFIKIFDPVPPFGVTERVPPFFFTAQLRQYDPGLKDVVIYANSCSSDIGVIVRYSKPSNDIPAETFIVAQLPDDTRRAQMPLPTTDGVQDTSPTGMAIDFSNKAAVERPIGTDEVEKSPGPLPILMVLSHEGFLSAWNIVYNDAIRTGNNYSGMAVYESNQSTVPQSPVPTTKPEVSPLVAPQSTTSGLGQTPFSANPTTTASPFAVAPTTPKAAFGASPGFGQLSSSSTPFRQPQPSATSGAFGQPPTLSSSRWNSTPSKPAFGQPSFGQTSFGQASQLRAGTTAPAAPLTGFGAGAGFAAFAGKGGFAAAAASASNTTQGGSIFGSGKSLATSTESVFGSGNTAGSEAFGSGNASNFKIGSAFKPVPSQANDSKQDDNSGSLGGIGMSLGGALVGSAAKSPSPANAPGSTPGMPASKPTPPTTSLPFSATPTASQQSPFTGYEGAGKGLFAPNPFTSVSTPKSAFGTPATPSGAFGFPSGSKTVAGSPSPAPVAQLLPDSPSPVPIAQLSPDFTKTPTKPKSLLSNAKDQSESAPALPSAPVQSLSDSPTPEEAPLPPDFVTLQNEAEPQDLPHLADNQSDESGDEFEEDEVEEDEQGDGEDGEGEEEEGEYQEEESEYQEEEGEYQEEESEYQEEEGEYQEEEGEYQEEDEVGEGPDEGEAGNRTAVETPKPANKSTLQPKKTTTPSNTSSVFDANTTYSNTFGDGGIQEGALFSHFCGKQQGEESSDQDDKDGDEEPVQLPSSSRGKGGWVGAAKGGISDRTKPAKKMSCNLPGGTGASKLARRLSVEKAAGMFTPKTDNEKTFSLPETQIGSFSESDKENRRDDQKAGWNASEGSTLEKPLFSSFTPPSKLSNALSQSRPSTPQSAQNLLSAFPGVSKSPVVGRASPVPRMANPLSLVSPHQTSTPEPPAEDAVSVVDFDAEYSDHEDEKIREQLLHGEIKPSDTLPEVKKLKEIEVPEVSIAIVFPIYLD
jgi:nucleoporin NUP159